LRQPLLELALQARGPLQFREVALSNHGYTVTHNHPEAAMVDNSKNRSEKNQKNKKDGTETHSPRVGETISLHDAAIALAEIAPSKKDERISDGKLLRALKSGEVQAGFHCSREPLIWISIPTGYWIDITSSVFRRIRVSPGKKNRTGVFLVTIQDFPKQYIAACIQVGEDSGQKLSSEWMIQTFEGAMARIESTFEVEIPRENWNQYLLKQPSSDVERVPDRNSGSGRRAFSGWKALNAMLAAYLVANNIRSEEDRKIEVVARDVLQIIKESKEKVQLPTRETFEKEVSHVFELISRLSMN
jgi:hypothetical protein